MPATRKPRTQPDRYVRLDGAVLTITAGKRADVYQLAELPADFGRAFRLGKADGTTYDVLLDGDVRSCECMGFLAHDHCKHLDSLAGLVLAGLL